MRLLDTLATEQGERALHRAELEMKTAVGDPPMLHVPLFEDRKRKVEDDGDDLVVETPGSVEQWLARSVLDARRVDDRQAVRAQALADDRVQDAECPGRHILVVLVIGRESATPVGGDDLSRLEVPGGEGRLARSRRPDE